MRATHYPLSDHLLSDHSTSNGGLMLAVVLVVLLVLVLAGGFAIHPLWLVALLLIALLMAGVR